MKTNYKLALAVLAGVLLGVAGAEVIHAQQVKTPPAYLIADVDVTDAATLFRNTRTRSRKRWRRSMPSISFEAARPRLSRAKRQSVSS
jgi:hypothetical protein